MGTIAKTRKAPNAPRRETIIRVRDRRARHQFSVHNLVIDQWAPIIGIIGLALYNLYVRFANVVDERSYPGYSLIQRHLKLGRSTISEHNKLLELCGLIQIMPGSATSTNDYYLLEIPTVTPERLRDLERKIEKSFSPRSRNRRTFLSRLKVWRPLFEGADKPAITVVRGSSPVDEQGSPVDEHPSPLDEQGVRQQDWGSPRTGLKQSEYNNPNRTIQNKQSESTTSSARHSSPQTAGAVADPLATLEDEERESFLSLLAEIGIADHGTQTRVAAAMVGHEYDLAELEELWQAIQKRVRTRQDISSPSGLFIVMVESGQKASAPSGKRTALSWKRYMQKLDEQGILH